MNILQTQTFSSFSEGLNHILSFDEKSPYKWYRLEGNTLYYQT